MIHLAHDILTGRRAVSTLTLIECIALMWRFEEDNLSDLREYMDSDLQPTKEQILAEAQLCAKVAVDCAEEDDEYWEVYGTF